MHRALGLCAKKRGQYDAAEKDLKRALELHRAQYGQHHAGCAELIADLADIARKKGQYE